MPAESDPEYWDQEEDQSIKCKRCGHEIWGETFFLEERICEECCEKEDEAVELAQQRQIDRWNEEPAEWSDPPV